MIDMFFLVTMIYDAALEIATTTKPLDRYTDIYI